MTKFTKIDIANAKEILTSIGKDLSKPHLLIGGIAVNHYVKARDSHDIDLICEHEVSQQIIKSFSTEDWVVDDSNDDPERPSFTVTNNSTPGLVIKFGPKITEREAYEYLDWTLFLEDAIEITYKNKAIENIYIPNASYLAYMKLISFHFRSDEKKKLQDIIDFVNLSNHKQFSMALFQSIVKKSQAEDILKNKSDSFVSYYSKIKENTVIYKFIEFFSRSDNEGKESIPVNRASSRGDSNFITQMVDAALFFRDATVFAVDEISQCITNKKVIPNRLLYKTDPGCKKWLELCGSPGYSFFQRSYNNLDSKSEEICGAIISKANRTDFDFVSLGVGDGKKDGLLLSSFLKKQEEGSHLYYYPMDINITMIERAAHNLNQMEEFTVDKDKLRIKPFVGDFFGIDNMELFYNYRKSPNIFSILGNTIGNGEESELIETLQGTIEENDFLIIEINTNQDSESIEKLEKSKISREHDLSPLHAIGVPVRDEDLDYTTIRHGEINRYSIISNTLTSIAECQLDGRRMRRFSVPIKGKIKLSIVHYYNFESFKEHIIQSLKMDVVYQSDTGGVGLLVLHKPIS